MNRFVAGFIGAPAMNFIDVTIRKVGDRRRRVAGGELAINEPNAPALEACHGRQVIMGLRPEHLVLGATAA